MPRYKLAAAAILALTLSVGACAPVFQANDMVGFSPVSPVGAPAP